MLESNISVLYTAVADRITDPSIRSLFLKIASDGAKNSGLLKEASRPLTRVKVRRSRADSKLASIFNMSYTIYQNIIAKEETETHLQPEELLAVSGKLILMEEKLCEEHLDAEAKVLKLLGRDAFLKQQTSIGNFGVLFCTLIDDSEQRQKTLRTIKNFIDGDSTQTSLTGKPCLPYSTRPIAEPCVVQARQMHRFPG
jgi:hypothetical protein